jgi:hypothetical protein
MERADVRVVEAGDGPGFPLEPLLQIGIGGDVFREDLDGDRAVKPRVGCLVDLL